MDRSSMLPYIAGRIIVRHYSENQPSITKQRFFHKNCTTKGEYREHGQSKKN